ncbi:PREDICTED: N-terminal Xaa-Pro-Lys N-methyltransferase 1-B-like [Amphimedon queenslandica]|uniref:Alpha N-terminal protein methyltransferase 1 n=1 Tax=Amphimedon queenslandica TaxID=400682 RepID=A0A1X7V6C9_AMPQE|nr:PREDICTED: N-terminal Xaa-Pro-Lys N-methyltransferase 1-B-like [Amphimedon queenslandica]|eukprot:XP_003385551.1 PREDICTED: N-terminal Xaa-Pro-Lys N-methyltransferase 1-B-like [Amphimedon queenslandica]
MDAQSEGKDTKDKMNSEDFYTNAISYWEGIPATVDGVMGGFANLSTNDVTGSKKFLSSFITGPEASVATNRALDCGAGIGRVSKRLLLPLFKEVDLEEQNPSFLERAKEYLGESGRRVGQFFPTGLQEFAPIKGHYDVIWCQWVLSHLRDADLILFLKRCCQGLVPHSGIIVVKENIARDEDEFDDNDSSVTRSMEAFLRIFSESNLVILKQELQPRWPENMFEVALFALKPKTT